MKKTGQKRLAEENEKKTVSKKTGQKRDKNVTKTGQKRGKNGSSEKNGKKTDSFFSKSRF